MWEDNSIIKKEVEKKFLLAYDQYAEKILKHIYFRVSSKETAEELTSEVFTRTWNYIRTGDKIKNFKAFLYRTAHNLIVDHYRQKARNKTIPLEDLKEQKDLKDAFLKNTEALIDFNLIKQEFDSLPQDYKDILTCRYINDLTIKETQEITGKSLIYVYNTTHRAVKLLKKKINEKGN